MWRHQPDGEDCAIKHVRDKFPYTEIGSRQTCRSCRGIGPIAKFDHLKRSPITITATQVIALAGNRCPGQKGQTQTDRRIAVPTHSCGSLVKSNRELLVMTLKSLEHQIHRRNKPSRSIFIKVNAGATTPRGIKPAYPFLPLLAQQMPCSFLQLLKYPQ